VFCTAQQTLVRIAVGLARVIAVRSTENQARGCKHLPATALLSGGLDPLAAQRSHVSRPLTRTFATVSTLVCLFVCLLTVTHTIITVRQRIPGMIMMIAFTITAENDTCIYMSLNTTLYVV